MRALDDLNSGQAPNAGGSFRLRIGHRDVRLMLHESNPGRGESIPRLGHSGSR